MSRHKKGFDKKNIFDRYNPDYTVIIVHCISLYSMRIIITIQGSMIMHQVIKQYNAVYSLWIANLNCRTQHNVHFDDFSFNMQSLKNHNEQMNCAYKIINALIHFSTWLWYCSFLQCTLILDDLHQRLFCHNHLIKAEL